MISFKKGKKSIVVFTFVISLFFYSHTVFAIETYAPGDTVTIGEFVYNDDFTPTTDDCTVMVYNPSGAAVVNNELMTADANGWHHYEYTAPATNGKYPAFISCGTLLGGDLVKQDKTFIVSSPSITNASIATSVWGNATRSLTTFGTLVSDVWSNAGRTLTSFGSLAADVWNDTYAVTRRLTDKTLSGGGSLATETAISASQTAIVSEIQTTQSLVSALNNISAADVWSHGTRSINSGTVTLSNSSLDDIWNTASSGLATSGSVGKLIVDNLDAQVSSRGTSNLTAADVWNAATRTLSDYSTSSIATAVWANATRTLTNYGNDITAEDVWNVLASSITATGSIGKQLALNIDGSISDVISEIQTNRTLINSLNNITAADVWASGTRTLTGTVTLSNSSLDDIWNTASSGLATSGSVGKLIVDNLDAQVSSRGTSNLTAADVWNAATRTLTDYSDSVIADAVWASGARTLTNYGNDITADDVWNVLSSSLTTVGSIGEQLKTNNDAKVSDVLAQAQTNASLISSLNNISASDVWGYAGRDLDGPVDLSAASQQAIWDVASVNISTAGSIGKQLIDNLDAQVSSRGTSNLTAADVWNAATRTLSDYSTSSIATAVWANATRTLTNYGNDITAEDVWNVLASTLTTVGTIGEQITTNLDTTVSSATGNSFSVKMSNVERVQTGYTYRAKIFILNGSTTPTAPFAIPTVTVYDASRNIVVSNVPTTLVDDGVYEYTYSVSSGAAQGLWETVASTEVESGKVIQTNDYWEVSGSPAQVLINSVSASNPSTISANITITNEGLSGYEYQYEWCVVQSVNNTCGNNDDTYHALAAKFINAGEDWNTALSATVPSAGTYYFKLVVYFGTDSSSASRIFTVPTGSSGNSGNGGGGGGGGGGVNVIPSNINQNSSTPSADLNGDGLVNSIDFSILLAFWKTKSPYKNPAVDINKDSKVDSVDFSILLYQWTKKKI